MAKKPRIGQPPKYDHRGGCARLSISLPKDLSLWLREEAHRRSMKLSALVVELLEVFKASAAVDKLTDDLKQVADDLGAKLIEH